MFILFSPWHCHDGGGPDTTTLRDLLPTVPSTTEQLLTWKTQFPCRALQFTELPWETTDE